MGRPARGRRRAFTLVELLAVIAIIGILAAILIPTIGAARARARTMQCMSNARNLATGMITHATQKERFPGRLEVVGTETVTWFGKILANVGGQQQWDLLLDGDPKYVQYMAIAVCPADPPPTYADAHLNYVANSGIWDTRPANLDIPANGICHDLTKLGSAGYVGLEDVRDGQSQTILLSENVDAWTWARVQGGRIVTANTFEGECDIVWPAGNDAWLGINREIGKAPERGDDPRFARPSSQHTGGVNVMFADGHGVFMSEDIALQVYGQLMSCYGRKTRNPINASEPLEWQVKMVLTEDMYQN